MTSSDAHSQDASDRSGTSVALCSYNGGRFIGDQLQSIAAQSKPVSEIVICDDGSTDATVQLIRDFAATSPIPVRVEINSSRLGVTKNFERAISLCRRKIIFLSDQDDLWHRDKVATLVHCFEDPAVGLAFSNAQVVAEDLRPAGHDLWQSVWFDAKEQQRVFAGDALPVLLRHAIAAGSTLAFRANHLPMILPIPDFPHSHDIWITLLIATVARICPVNEPLVRYRLHTNNVVGLKSHSLLGQIRMARQQLNNGAFDYAAKFHQAALDRLSQFSIDERTKSLFTQKIAHSRVRHEMPTGWFARLPLITRELREDNYRRYSYGYKSVLQDLFLR